MSKAYGVIRRFSEDVDLTYGIRAIASDLVGDANSPLPANKSQEKKWSKEIRARLSDGVGAEIVPRLTQDLEQNDLPASARAEGVKVFIDYTPLVTGTGYVAPTVMLKFGARSTGEPSEPRAIHTVMQPRICRGWSFPPQHQRLCAPSSPSGKRLRRFTFFAPRASFAVGFIFPALRAWYWLESGQCVGDGVPVVTRPQSRPAH